MRKIALLGATGSIGRSCLQVLRLHPERFCLHSVAAGSRHADLAQIINTHHPARAVIADADALAPLRAAVQANTVLDAGAEAVCALARDPAVDIVIAAIVGAAGLAATLAAAEAGKTILLANKEALVVGGPLVVAAALRSGATLIPVDSEHNAILQCLPAAQSLPPYRERPAGVQKLWLTASGGPFLTYSAEQMRSVTVEQALRHPNWSMGDKITIDSATLMNKGLEVAEAHYLFGLPADDIHVVVHPQSLVHSLVEYSDGSHLAQLGAADMRTPIACALGWPDRITSGVPAPAPTHFPALDFSSPDLARFPCLGLAYSALRAGHAALIVLNAANEVAVAAFLKGKIGYTQIADAVNDALQATPLSSPTSLPAILDIDRRARQHTMDQITRRL